MMSENATKGPDAMMGRSASGQAGYQLAALAVSLLIAIVGGAVTGMYNKMVYPAYKMFKLVYKMVKPAYKVVKPLYKWSNRFIKWSNRFITGFGL